MRRMDIPEELAQQVDAFRGDTAFETYVALAIQEKTWGSRFITPLIGAEIEEMWVAVVQHEGNEAVLLWRMQGPTGVAMMPVITFGEEGMQDWEEQFALELNVMDGPTIVWRHYEGGECAGYLRRSIERDPE